MALAPKTFQDWPLSAIRLLPKLTSAAPDEASLSSAFEVRSIVLRAIEMRAAAPLRSAYADTP